MAGRRPRVHRLTFRRTTACFKKVLRLPEKPLVLRTKRFHSRGGVRPATQDLLHESSLFLQLEVTSKMVLENAKLFTQGSPRGAKGRHVLLQPSQERREPLMLFANLTPYV